MTQEQFTPSIDRPAGQSPLRRFKGVLDHYAPDKRTYENREYMVITFSFADIEVIESVEPYPFPIAQITVSYSPPAQSRGGSKWEAFASSLRKLETDGLDAIVGRHQEWAMLPCKLRQALTDEDGQPLLIDDGRGGQRQQWGDVDAEAWQVVEVEGMGSVEEADKDFDEYLVGLADLKSERDFYEAALTDPKVTARPPIVTAITDRKLIETLMAAGKLSRDAEGILHRAGSEVSS